jgi:hypothetical protein
MGITPSEISCNIWGRQNGPDKVDDEIRRITGYDEWHNLVDDAESDDHGDTALHDSSVTRATIVVRPRH